MADVGGEEKRHGLLRAAPHGRGKPARIIGMALGGEPAGELLFALVRTVEQIEDCVVVRRADRGEGRAHDPGLVDLSREGDHRRNAARQRELHGVLARRGDELRLSVDVTAAEPWTVGEQRAGIRGRFGRRRMVGQKILQQLQVGRR